MGRRRVPWGTAFPTGGPPGEQVLRGNRSSAGSLVETCQAMDPLRGDTPGHGSPPGKLHGSPPDKEAPTWGLSGGPNGPHTPAAWHTGGGVDIGLILPQGFFNEFEGWEAAD